MQQGATAPVVVLCKHTAGLGMPSKDVHPVGIEGIEGAEGTHHTLVHLSSTDALPAHSIVGVETLEVQMAMA